MKCDWGCGEQLTASRMRPHFIMFQKGRGIEACERLRLVAKQCGNAKPRDRPPALPFGMVASLSPAVFRGAHWHRITAFILCHYIARINQFSVFVLQWTYGSSDWQLIPIREGS
jgi:hypothetical protein